MLGYRSFVYVDALRDQVVKYSLEQLRAWLRYKTYDADALEVGELRSLGQGVDGILVEELPRDGSHWVRARIFERKIGWTTQLTVGVPGRAADRPWVWLDVEAPDDHPG